MLYGLYLSAGGLEANERRMAVGANNLANVNTVGFKLDSVAVEPLRRAAGFGGSEPAELAMLGGGVMARRSFTEFRSGPMETTGQPFDVALDTGAVANGFIGVQSADGKPLWTRDGRLTLDSSGRLVTQTGRLAVLNDKDQPITIDQAGGPVNIAQDGTIRQGTSELATLRLASFANPELLVKQGACQFQAPGSCKPGQYTGQVVQGYIEGSAADPTALLAQMIMVQRAYEANANMIKCQDQTLGLAVNSIAKI